MNKIFVSIIFTLSLHSLHSHKILMSPLLKINNDSCRREVLQMYLPTANLSSATSPSKDMLEMCPNLEESCCTAEELGFLHGQVMRKKPLLDKFVEHYLDLQTRILSLSKENIKMLQVSMERTRCKNKEGNLDVALDVLKSRKGDLEERLLASVAHFSKLGSSFACSLCEQKNGFFFKTKPPNKAMISVNIDTCNDVFPASNSSKIFGFFNDAYFVNLFVESLSCIAFSPFSLEPVLDDVRLGDILHQADKCREVGDWAENPRCLTVCSSLPFINQNIFFKMMTPVQIARSMFSQLFGEEQKDKRVEEVLIEKMNKEKERARKGKDSVEFKFFIENEEPDVQRLEELEWDVKKGSGWHFAQSPVKEFMKAVGIAQALFIGVGILLIVFL